MTARADKQAAVLALIEARAFDVAAAERELEKAIRAAHRAKLSLRKIGPAAGLSHEQVRRVLAKGRA